VRAVAGTSILGLKYLKAVVEVVDGQMLVHLVEQVTDVSFFFNDRNDEL
jgi:hypothetical protein